MERLCNELKEIFARIEQNEAYVDDFSSRFYMKKIGLGPFSLFDSGPDKLNLEYENCLAKQICYLCEKGTLEVSNNPCGCVLWCCRCAAWAVDQMGDQSHCLICNSEVRRINFKGKGLDFVTEVNQGHKHILKDVLGERYNTRRELVKVYLERQENKCINCNKEVDQEYEPCRCRIWCDTCLDSVTYVLHYRESIHSCLICGVPVVQTRKFLNPVRYSGIPINKKTDNQELKKRLRHERQFEKAKKLEEEEKKQLAKAKEEESLFLSSLLACSLSSINQILKRELAVTFSDLHMEAGIKSLNDFLSRKSYICGDQLTKDDIKVYAAVLEKPSGVLFPNASKWFDSVSSQLATCFPGRAAAGVRIGGQSALVEAAPAKEAAKEPAGDDDNDLNFFGDEAEEEKGAAEEREAAAKAPSKKKERWKSSFLLIVKPWDDETDMKKLEEAVRSIEMPGLLWGASKLQPVAYGIKKMTIMMTIVDDLVSVDTLIEERLTVEPFNEYIKSCDIVAFNKI